MDDLHGSATQRLDQIDALAAQDTATREWLWQQLRSTLTELAASEPVADAEQDRREDF